MNTSHLNNLAPGRSSKFNLAADFFALTTAAVVVSTEGAWTWYQPALVALVLIPTWVVVAKVLRQYDIWHKQGILGELALTSVLVLGLAAELFLMELVLPAKLVPAASVQEFLLLAWPSLLTLRMFVIVVRAMKSPR